MQPQDEQPSSPASCTSLSEQEEDVADVAESSGDPKAPPALAVSKEQKTAPSQALVMSSSSKEQVMQIDSANETTPLQETATEEALRLTRARSRKTRAAASNR